MRFPLSSALCASLALALVACTPSPPTPAGKAGEGSGQAASPPAPEDRPAVQGSVTIAGQDAAEDVQQWTPPRVDREGRSLAQLRRAAEQAFAQDRLYEDGDAAIPLWLAVQEEVPDDRQARAGLQRARQRLLQQTDALLVRPLQQREALAEAGRQALVLLTLAPDDEKVRALQARVEIAQRVVAYNRAGEEDLRADRIGEDGDGAIGSFREALALDEGNRRARQGLAAAESGLIRRAEEAARRRDFASAGTWLAEASKVRDSSPTIADAFERIEQIRANTLAQLRDEGLRDLATPQGLKPAREKLAEALRIALPGDAVVAQLRERIDLATHYGSFRPGQVFSDAMRDGGRGPQMVVVPHGGFQMGAGDAEPGATDAERPSHYVRFDRGFAMAITEVTVSDFERYVKATNARPRATRRGHSVVYDERSGNFIRRSGVDWRSDYDGARALGNAPVMHVSVRDAENYAAWLSEQTGYSYRLPSEAEFEYALRAGSSGRYPWGDTGTPPPGSGNFTGSKDVSPSGRHWHNAFIGYGDGWWGPAPVANFRANAFGLHDMAGNLSEWVADCWHSSYRRAPSDGVAWFNPGCRARVIRGGNWANSPEQTRAAWRQSQDSDTTNARIGFRLVRGI
ncbi:SUMF1/EgtB/PvdO family nonheme iron enzyme [Stenotrophomonas sp. TWI169]|uniref:formylglycine-generating enzyme family protein n=1 Tax=Stenotrophomonas TaxID=40323 RepID=UPI001875F8F1|nr:MULTISPECIES: formylglycine-generating enzyme family protein [Stenotrophomonas]MBE5270085.1 SUMF1/EgtB/PvdO family nonheme iron enzyme [Stenotrophomonas sp. B2]MBN4938908.1 SUMF1/EgtB/PvdO family nonheme iron enzyme [Stenotrophomonas maltophilia]UXY47264.1 formylglycine-generating enzyme family protein [Stenotrophomonas maltophilia]HEL4256725.1 SUMF1/EgtB/PvdO family nonheme iron enzyme [Stenotrophomonas maltophilia]HEL7631296.1 SUMF1/EgtB/PvdO family nonheme iron enzyme [Stenotrophomonas m